VLSAGLLLSLMVWVFSDEMFAQWTRNKGLRFTQINQILLTEKSAPKVVVKKRTVPKPDTIILKNLTAGERFRIDTLHKKIQYLNNHTSGGNTALDGYFAALNSAKDSLIHIWYYGDSQIEGDRITQDLRFLLQKQFGGSGQGLVPFNDVASYRFLETHAQGFTKYNIFNHRKTSGFGFSGIKYRYSATDSGTAQTGFTVSQGLKFSKVYLLHDKDVKSTVKVSIDKQNEKEIVLTGHKTLIHEGRCRDMKLTYHPTSTAFYGYLLEGEKGIQIDNCGIRGHSGDGLFNISNATLQLQSRILNTRLIVFHYGNNAIPYIRSEAHAAQVGNEFYKLFVKYRKALPHISILVVSGGDMGRIIEEKPESYPYAGALAVELEKAAEKAGCAFFDMHALMQSDGGIAGWVKQGKASIDGHLSAYGQKFFAQALHRELMKSYEIYQLSHTLSH
jgi:hypothetical protein